MGAIVVGRYDLALDTLRNLSKLLASKTETTEEEQARKTREDEGAGSEPPKER